MNFFEFYNPVRVVFEAKGITRLGSLAGGFGKTALIVSYEKADYMADTLNLTHQQLNEAGIDTHSFYQVSENPTIQQVEAGVLQAKAQSVDFVIGVGGGSVMDAAKAIAAGVLYQGKLWDMVATSHKSDSQTVFPSEALPTVMIPTMAATGSEMNCCAVISNEETKEKSYMWDDCLFPTLAIVDPELTFSLPAYQTACGAADIFSHVLEFYINGLEDTPMNYAIQEGVMEMVLTQTERVLKNPSDLRGRSDLQWGAILALNGISQPGNAWTPMHQVGHVLSSRYGVAHGASLALVMPSWMRYMWKTRKDQYVRFAKSVMKVEANGKLENEVIIEGIDRFEEFLNRIKISTRISDFKIPTEDIPSIVKEVSRISFNDEQVLPSHTAVTEEMIAEILMLSSQPKNEKVLL